MVKTWSGSLLLAFLAVAFAGVCRRCTRVRGLLLSAFCSLLSLSVSFSLELDFMSYIGVRIRRPLSLSPFPSS